MAHQLVPQDLYYQLRQAKRKDLLFMSLFVLVPPAIFVVCMAIWGVGDVSIAGLFAGVMASLLLSVPMIKWGNRSHELTQMWNNDPRYLLQQAEKQPRYTVTSSSIDGEVAVRLFEKDKLIEERRFGGVNMATIEEACTYQVMLCLQAEQKNQQYQDQLIQKIAQQNLETPALVARAREADELQQILVANRWVEAQESAPVRDLMSG
jgi:hypothetical protein